MSGKVTGWVLERSPVQNTGQLLLLVVLADCAHDDGAGAYPSVNTMAERTRQSKRKVQQDLHDLEAAGHIARDGVSEYKTTKWRVMMPRDDYRTAPPRPDRRGDAPPAPPRNGDAPCAPEPTATTEPPQLALEKMVVSGLGAPPAPPDAPTLAEWRATVDALKATAPQKYESWLAEVELHTNRNASQWTLSVPEHKYSWVAERYLPLITRAAREVTGREISIDVVSAPRPAGESETAGRGEPSAAI